jgi:hypothetical protein
MRINEADVAELVDARDLKSLDGNVVWVRVPPPAPIGQRIPFDRRSGGSHCIMHAIPERTFWISFARRRMSTFQHGAICSLRECFIVPRTRCLQSDSTGVLLFNSHALVR